MLPIFECRNHRSWPLSVSPKWPVTLMKSSHGACHRNETWGNCQWRMGRSRSGLSKAERWWFFHHFFGILQSGFSGGGELWAKCGGANAMFTIPKWHFDGSDSLTIPSHGSCLLKTVPRDPMIDVRYDGSDVRISRVFFFNNHRTF